MNADQPATGSVTEPFWADPRMVWVTPGPVPQALKNAGLVAPLGMPSSGTFTCSIVGPY